MIIPPYSQAFSSLKEIFFMRRKPSANMKLADTATAVFRPSGRQLKEFSINGHKVMAYSRKDAITRLKHRNKIK